MEIIDIWVHFGSLMHQDFLIEYPDFFSGISAIIQDLSVAQRGELYDFLSELTKSGYSTEQQLDIWLESGAQFSVGEDQISDFLSHILELVEKANHR